MVVRSRRQRARLVLDGRRAVALHAVFRARLPVHRRRPRPLDGHDVLVRRAPAARRAGGTAVGRVPRRLDRARVADRPSRRRTIPLAGARHVARRRAGARAMGRPRRRARRHAVAGVVQRRHRRSVGGDGERGKGERCCRRAQAGPGARHARPRGGVRGMARADAAGARGRRDRADPTQRGLSRKMGPGASGQRGGETRWHVAPGAGPRASRARRLARGRRARRPVVAPGLG